MNFSTGQTVVHPHHGPATVTDITTRLVRGVPTTYLRLTVRSTNLVLGVPLEQATDLGLRAVLDDTQAEDLLTLLRSPSGEQQTVWSRRIKDNSDKVRSGDLFTIAAVVRDLTRRNDERGLSLAEKDLLRDARTPLVAELAVHLSVSDTAAGHRLDDAIRGTTSGTTTERQLATAS